MRTRSIISVCKITVSFFMTFILILTMGCSSDKGKKEETSSYSKLNPFSKDADEGKDCADVVKILLDQKFHYKNDEAIRLAHNALLMIHANPWPLSELDEKFGRYNKRSLQSGLHSRLVNDGLSYEHADEIASAFADLNELTKYTVSAAGEKVNRNEEGEYHIIKLHMEYPDVEKVEQMALKVAKDALTAKSETLRDVDSKKNSKGIETTFENMSKAQLIEFENIIYESYMKVLKDTANIPYKIYDGKISMMRKETKEGVPAYVFYDKDGSVLALNINIWKSLGIDLSRLNSRYNETVVSLTKVGSFKGIDDSKKFSIAPCEVNVKKKYAHFKEGIWDVLIKNPKFGTNERTPDSNVAYLEIDVALIVDNSIMNDIEWECKIAPTYGRIGHLYQISNENKSTSADIFLFEVPKNTKKKFQWTFVTAPYYFDDDEKFRRSNAFSEKSNRESEMAEGTFLMSLRSLSNDFHSEFVLPLKVVPARN